MKQVLLSTQPREQVYLQRVAAVPVAHSKNTDGFFCHIYSVSEPVTLPWMAPHALELSQELGVRTDLGLLRRGGRSYSRWPNLQTELRHRPQESGSGYLHQVPALYRPQEKPIFY